MKIFRKEKKKNGRRHIFFMGIKVASYKKKLKATASPVIITEPKAEKKKTTFEIYDYLKKYSYILDKNFSIEDSKESNYVWQYWGQGIENAPDIVKRCFESVNTYCSDSKIIRLTDDTVENYIELPSFIKEKMKKGIISKTHFSDYLRTCLLAKYGGTWIDATVLLTDKIPNNILNSDFFVFRPIAWSECGFVPSMQMLKLLDKIPTYLGSFLCLSVWFIHTKTNNRILLYTKALLEEYWKNETTLIDYFIFHYFITLCVLNDNGCKKIYETMPNLANRNPHLLQNVLLDKYDEILFSEIKKLSSIHKLTYKKTDSKTSFMSMLLANNYKA
ncbi:MAG: capsular polysaccharide synthesis protein [Alphaproteobacteria bacterium]|nr:capsular polysaccharide synthesis protein [Alphaproteobacteria bacterium]